MTMRFMRQAGLILFVLRMEKVQESYSQNL